MLPKPNPRHTTNSNHRYHKWKNLIKGFVPTAPNRLWVADITYIPIATGDVCYLHLITDACSHKVVGWALADTLRAAITIAVRQKQIGYLQSICLWAIQTLLLPSHRSWMPLRNLFVYKQYKHFYPVGAAFHQVLKMASSARPGIGKSQKTGKMGLRGIPKGWNSEKQCFGMPWQVVFLKNEPSGSPEARKTWKTSRRGARNIFIT